MQQKLFIFKFPKEKSYWFSEYVQETPVYFLWVVEFEAMNKEDNTLKPKEKQLWTTPSQC